MPAAWYFSPEDPMELKLQIERKLGSVKACKYFDIFRRYLSLKIRKCEFDRLCISTIGRENVPLHNCFTKSILRKACLSKSALPPESRVESFMHAKMPNGCNNLQFLCKDFPQSPRKGRTHRRFRDRSSPLGPHGKNNSLEFEDSAPKVHEQQSNIDQQSAGSRLPLSDVEFEDSASKIHEQQSNIDRQSAGSRLPLSVEDGKEVHQDSENLMVCRSPVRAPLAIPTYIRRQRKHLCQGLTSDSATDTCQSIDQLPDTCSLTKRLEQKLEIEGVKISIDAANLLNNALDVYLKRLIKPCLDLAASKSVNKFSSPIQPGMNGLQMSRSMQKPIGSVSASISDFRTALELNPTLLGEDWSLHLEKVCFRALEE